MALLSSSNRASSSSVGGGGCGFSLMLQGSDVPHRRRAARQGDRAKAHVEQVDDAVGRFWAASYGARSASLPWAAASGSGGLRRRVRWADDHMLGESLDLFSGAGSQSSPGRVECSCRHAETDRVDQSHSSRETDAGGGEHGVAGSRVVERLEHRPGDRDALTGAFVSDEDGSDQQPLVCRPTAWRSILSTLGGRDVRARRRVRSDGDMLCNHRWSHPDLARSVLMASRNRFGGPEPRSRP